MFYFSHHIMKILEDFFSKKAIGAISVAFIIYLILLIGAVIYAENNKEMIMNIIISIFGSTVGWLLGVAASPYYLNEDTRFKTILGSIATFVSGFSLGSLKDSIDNVNFSKIDEYGIAEFRVMLLIISIISALQATYAIRAYDVEKEREEQVKKAQQLDRLQEVASANQ